MSSIAFRASARTIDHLGKGQIADTPTAVSELWKNSYDAYARNVALHLYDDEVISGVLFDDGCGMTLEQIHDSWLVVGTSSKTNKQILPEKDRFNLPLRRTQGEKGIGRLSSAFLAPVMLLVTKKIDTEFSAVLVDWRMFENPYLSLSEIRIPFKSFKNRTEIQSVFYELVQELGKSIPNRDAYNQLTIEERSTRLAWDRFTSDEQASKDFKISTEDLILDFCANHEFQTGLTSGWFDALNNVANLDGEPHGTALFLLDLNRELTILTNRAERAFDNYEVQDIQEALTDTLKAFTNPFSESKKQFNYEIVVFDKFKLPYPILSSKDVFGIEEFAALEHKIDGEIDERGWFKGSVTAFGIDLGKFTFPPNIPIEQSVTASGPFKIKIGAFEPDLAKSSYSKDVHAKISKSIAKDHGILVFRDDLRVLPFGRLDYDFFEIEERRSTNAGRHFWASRKMLGHISIDQKYNAKLRDKAGREGFIKNFAAREFKHLVVDHLINFADKFFGTKSDKRQELLAVLSLEKEQRKREQSKAKKHSEKSFREALKTQRPLLDEKIVAARELHKELSEGLNYSSHQIRSLLGLIKDLEEFRGKLKTPVKPPKVAGKNEELYRSYRDIYNEYSELLKVSQATINRIEARNSDEPAFNIGKRYFDSKQAMLNAQVSSYERKLKDLTDSIKIDWMSKASVDRSKFYSNAISVLEGINDKQHLEEKLNNLEAIYLSLADTFTIEYEALIGALERMLGGVNLYAAFSMSEEEKEYFEEKAQKLSGVAQLGASVEIMAHELEHQDLVVTRGLNSLPHDIKSHAGFQSALSAHKQLTDHIRFISTLKLSGYQARQTITGDSIESYIRRFFRDRFERQRVQFTFSTDAQKLKIIDLPSRIHPVFINIVNNALYWVCLSETRKITIDVIGNLVVIGNTGPEVDEDDIEKLFELFYSRRTSGNGVGLYLCKENLAVANHEIWYATRNDEKIFQQGANFVIKFHGIEIND